MALSKTIETIHGFQALNAYHRVEAVSLTSKEQISFHLRSYTASGKPFFVEQIMTAPYQLDGSNPIKQAYQHLKTLDDFAGALDC
jgi:phenylalanine-4-hydroxylase